MNNHEAKRQKLIRKQRDKEDKETLLLIIRGMRRCNIRSSGNKVIDNKINTYFGEVR